MCKYGTYQPLNQTQVSHLEYQFYYHGFGRTSGGIKRLNIDSDMEVEHLARQNSLAVSDNH